MPNDLASILQTMLDGVVAIDAKGYVVGWNAVVTDIFGWTEEKALGQSMGGLIVPPQHRAAHSRMWRARCPGVMLGLLDELDVRFSALDKEIASGALIRSHRSG